MQKWRQIQSDNQHASLKEWLSEFYDILLSMWHTQVSRVINDASDDENNIRKHYRMYYRTLQTNYVFSIGLMW